MENIILKKVVKSITIENFSYEYKIGLDNIIPKGYDITGINLDWSIDILCIHIEIGGSIIASFYETSINNLSKYRIYLSLLKYHTANIIIVYKNDWIKENSFYYDSDEFKEIIEFGENVEIYNEYNEFQIGKLVYRKSSPIKIRKNMCNMIIPQIIIKIEKGINTDILFEYSNNDNINNNVVIYSNGMAGLKFHPLYMNNE